MSLTTSSATDKMRGLAMLAAVVGPPVVGAYLGAKLMPNAMIVGIALGGFGGFFVTSYLFRGGL